MSENGSNGSPGRDSSVREWLTAAILCLSVLTLVGIAAGALLFARISSTFGIGAANPQHGEPAIPVYTDVEIDKFITSVLIVIQNEPLAGGGAPADMVFIASFDAFEQELTIAALDARMMLDTPLGDSTIAAYYADAGAAALVSAVNGTFDLGVKYYACTDTASLAAMIDLLGGIEAELTPDEAGYLNDAVEHGAYPLRSGAVVLNGTQSMVHALDSLSGQGQFGGLDRSLRLVDSAVSNMRKTATKEAMLPLLSLVSGSIRTNLDFSTLHDMGYEILKADEMGLASIRIPVDGSSRRAAGGGLRIERGKNAAALREALYGSGGE